MAPVVGVLSLRNGSTTGITAPPGVSTEMKMTTGGAAARRLYHRREGTRGTAIVPVGLPKEEAMTTPSSTVCWRARPGGREGTEGLGGWTRTVTPPPKAAPEERAAIVTTAGRQATVQKRRTLYLRTLSWRRSGTAGPTWPRTDTARQNLRDLRDTGRLNPPRGPSVTPAPTRGRPIRYRAAERTGTGTETW